MARPGGAPLAVPRRLLLLAVTLSATGMLLVAGGCGREDEPGSGPGDAGRQAGDPADAEGPIRRDPANAKVTLTIGSKNFTEQRVLGELFAQGLEAAGFVVRRRLNLGDEQVAQQALLSGQIDGYPEYTGTALLSLCGVPNAEVPKDPAQAFRDARACLAERGETAFAPTPFTSSNEVGVKRRIARRFDLQRISDLAEVSDRFTLFGSRECRRRADCLVGLQRVYGMRFGSFRPVPIPERFAVLRTSEPAASIVFTTDPQITRENVVLLEDDRGMFPPYNSTFLARDEVVQDAGPALGQTIEKIGRLLTDETMQELNAQVDIDRRSPATVARGHLRRTGLVAAE